MPQPLTKNQRGTQNKNHIAYFTQFPELREIIINEGH
jgi:hypothetical protein